MFPFDLSSESLCAQLHFVLDPWRKQLCAADSLALQERRKVLSIISTTRAIYSHANVIVSPEHQALSRE
jgi:hypothetical protein